MHPSVGTEAEIAAREETRKKMEALRLSRAHLEPYVLALQELKDWGYIVEIPSGPGGDRPSDEGSIKKCDRCSQQFKVKRREEADECIYHYGKPFTTRANGNRIRSVFKGCRLLIQWFLFVYFRREAAVIHMLLPTSRGRRMSTRTACILRVCSRRAP